MKHRRIWIPALLCLAVLAALLWAFAPQLRELAARPSAPSPHFTGLAEAGGRRFYFVDGRFQAGYTGLAEDYEAGSWWMVENGLVAPAFTGFAENARGWWYAENGRVDFARNALIEGTVNGEAGRWYVAGGRVRTDYTGLDDYAGAETLFYVENGRVRPDYTGFAQSARGWWYVEEGEAQPEKTGLVEGTLGGEQGCWYVENGRVRPGLRGLADLGADGLWFVDGGRVFPKMSGLVRLDGETRYVENGKISLRRMALEAEEADWIVEDGRAWPVTNEDERMYFLALRLVAELTDEDMAQEDKLSRCFWYLVNDCGEYNPRLPHYCGEDWPEIYACDILADGAGNCFSYGAAFAYIAKAIGCEEVYACSSGAHGWTEIGGMIYDPEWTKHSAPAVYYALPCDAPAAAEYRQAVADSDEPAFAWKRREISFDPD